MIEICIRVCVRIFRISQNIFFRAREQKEKSAKKSRAHLLEIVRTRTHITHTRQKQNEQSNFLCFFGSALYAPFKRGFSYLFLRLQAVMLRQVVMYIAQRRNACLRLCMNLTHARRSTH